MEEVIVTPPANRAPVWRHFGYGKDATTGKLAVGKKAKCKLCRAEVAHSGGMTNLKNHLRSHHRHKYRELYNDEPESSAEAQSQQKMDVFRKPSNTAEKLPSSSARPQELTTAVVDFVVRDLVNAISENLMLVAIPCAGHSLNLAVQDALAVTGLRTALGRAKKIVEHFNRSRLDNEELKAKQKQLGLPSHCLIQDVVTRWNSTLDMASRLCEQQAAIAAVLHGKHDLHHLEPSPQEWYFLEDLVKLLEPFKNATEILSGQKYPTLSCLGPILVDLQTKIKADPQDSTAVKLAKEAMRRDLSGRYQDPDVLAFMHKAALLDPRFKTLAHLPATTAEDVAVSIRSEMVQFLQQDVNQPSESETNQTNERPPPQTKQKVHPLKKLLGDKFGAPSQRATAGSVSLEDQAEAELVRYKSKPQSPLEHCPLQWWRDHCTST